MTGEQTRARRENQSSGDKAALPDCGTGEFQLRRAHCNKGCGDGSRSKKRAWSAKIRNLSQLFARTKNRSARS